MDICLLVLKESTKSKFDSYSVRNSVSIISPYYVPSGIVACTLFPTILEIAVNEFPRQQSWKEYPRTKSANAKNFAYKRGLIGGEFTRPTYHG